MAQLPCSFAETLEERHHARIPSVRITQVQGTVFGRETLREAAEGQL